jgi:hypothetical protein
MSFVKSLAVYDTVKSFVYTHSIGWCNEQDILNFRLVVLSEMEGSKLECCQLQISLKKKKLQLFVGQIAFLGVLFSLVSYIFDAIPTTVFLPHLLFALKSPV